MNTKRKHKYDSNMELRRAALVARYGSIAKTTLADAALQLWRLEPQLKKVEDLFGELVDDLGRLRQAQQEVCKLWKFSGLTPDFIYRRDRALSGIVKAIDDYLLMTKRVWKSRCVVQDLHDRAKIDLDRQYGLATRKLKQSLPELKRRSLSGKVADPAALQLISLTRQAVITDRLRPGKEDHHGKFDIILRPNVAQRFRLPWLVDIMLLSSPEFQGRLPAKDLGLEYQAAAKALGWELAGPKKHRGGESLYCECGAPLERYAAMRSLPFPTSAPAVLR